MPTYEYECSKGHRFEAVQRISDPPLERCQECRSKVHRLISAPAFILKGGGWYADGYSGSRSSNGGGHGDGDGKSKESKESPAASDKSSKSDQSAKGEASSKSSSEARTSEPKPASAGKSAD